MAKKVARMSFFWPRKKDPVHSLGFVGIVGKKETGKKRSVAVEGKTLCVFSKFWQRATEFRNLSPTTKMQLCSVNAVLVASRGHGGPLGIPSVRRKKNLRDSEFFFGQEKRVVVMPR